MVEPADAQQLIECPNRLNGNVGVDRWAQVVMIKACCFC